MTNYSQPTTNEGPPKTLFGKIKRKIRWKKFIKTTLNLIDRDIKDQQATTIIAVIDEISNLKIPITNDAVIMDIIEVLKNQSENLRALRVNYTTLKHDLIRFFARMDKILKGE